VIYTSFPQTPFGGQLLPWPQFTFFRTSIHHQEAFLIFLLIEVAFPFSSNFFEGESFLLGLSSSSVHSSVTFLPYTTFIRFPNFCPLRSPVGFFSPRIASPEPKRFLFFLWSLTTSTRLPDLLPVDRRMRRSKSGFFPALPPPKAGFSLWE